MDNRLKMVYCSIKIDAMAQPEQCKRYFERGEFKLAQINYPHLTSLNSKGPKGARSSWFHYKTVHKDVTLVHKSEKGDVDLSFRGAYDKIPLLVELFEEANGSLKQTGMSIEPAGKSAVLRMKVPSVDVLDAFDNYKDEVDTCLKAVESLNDIALRLDGKKVQEILHI